MKYRHTPGPWQVSAGAVDNQRLIVENDLGLPVCAMSLRGVQGDINKMEANARLIAAAPDLLQSCRGMLHALEADCRDTDKWAALMGEAIAAIAKATGSQT